MIPPCLRFSDEEMWILDQTLLPQKEQYEQIRSVQDIADAVRKLKIRGAPLLGVLAAFALAFLARRAEKNEEAWADRFITWIQELRNTRPTAVNLYRSLNRMESLFFTLRKENRTAEEMAHLLWEEASRIAQEEESACENISHFGAHLVPKNAKILTHCNAGSFATYGIGTALGIIRKANEQKKNPFIWVSETRPLFQGSRLTAYELEKLGIPYKIIVDSAAGHLFAREEVQMVLVGADRIAANGDTANKVGTRLFAVLAQAHQIPFFVAAPTSSFDPELSTGERIPIEWRDPQEILSAGSQSFLPLHFCAENPAFDITEFSLITAFITEQGIFRPQQIDKLLLEKR